MKFVQFVKNYFWIICSFIVLVSFGIIYINETFVDVLYLDGLMPVPVVNKYFQGDLSFADINMSWSEHRLIGYSLIFLFKLVPFSKLIPNILIPPTMKLQFN